jgi:beta-glucosidase
MGGLDFWSPNLNIFRDPRWGRGQETYGEDPFLTGRMGVAYVTGLQGDDPKYYLAIATPKHYAVHSGPEPTRHFADVDVSKHDEVDTYEPAFRAAIVEGKAGSVMCAYNAINGEPACANQYLLQDQLRGKWGFQGYVVSDCDAVSDVAANHRYRPDPGTRRGHLRHPRHGQRVRHLSLRGLASRSKSLYRCRAAGLPA